MKHKHVILVMAVVSLVCLITGMASCAKDEGEGIKPIPEAALKARFGQHVVRHFDTELDQSREEWISLGVFWENYHSGYATWQEIEPSKGSYHWETIDAYVKGAQASGVQILFTI